MSDDATSRPLPPWSPLPIGTPVAPAPPARALTAPITDEAALRLLLVAVAGGLVAQSLFVGELFGINVVIWTGFVLGAAVAFRRRDVAIDRRDLWLPPAALAFGAFVAVRGDAPLMLFNTLASWGLLVACAVALRGVPVTRGAWSTLLYVSGVVGALLLTGASRIGGGLRPLRVPMARESMVMRVVAGLLLALPLVVVFGALFAAADAVFATQLQRVLAVDLDLGDVIGRAIFAGFAAWLLAGVLLIAWLTNEAVGDAPVIDIRRRLGVIETSIALLAVDAVFAVFVVLQAAYLFGGLDTLAASGLTYSEYARRGFFELIAVAVLAGVVLLALDALVERRSMIIRGAAIALGLLTGAVLVSAVTRLMLYQQAYGWTELRFYALLAICWLGVGVVAVVGALVFDRLRVVPRVLLVALFALALAANVVGPQRFVTEQNLARAIDPTLVPVDGWSGLDVDYLSSLGVEAMPLLVEAVPRLPADVRADVELALNYEAELLRLDAAELGWPSFNLARARALDALTTAGY